MSHSLLAQQRRSYRAQLKEREEEVGRRRGVMTKLKSEQDWIFASSTQEKGRKGLMLSHLWCPNDLPTSIQGYGVE